MSRNPWKPIAIALAVLMMWVLRKPRSDGPIPIMHVTILPAIIMFLLVFGGATLLHLLNIL